MNKKANTWSQVLKIIIVLVILGISVLVLYRYVDNARTNIETCPGTCRSSCNFPAEMQYASTCLLPGQAERRDQVCCVTPEDLRNRENRSESDLTGEIGNQTGQQNETEEEQVTREPLQHSIFSYHPHLDRRIDLANNMELSILGNQIGGYIRVQVSSPRFALCNMTVEEISGPVMFPEYNVVLSKFEGCDSNIHSPFEVTYTELRNIIETPRARVTVDILEPSEELRSRTVFYLIEESGSASGEDTIPPVSSLTSESSDSQRKDSFCSDSNPQFVACMALAQWYNKSSGNEVPIANCQINQVMRGPDFFTYEYNCQSQIQTTDVNPGVDNNLTWSYYYTLNNWSRGTVGTTLIEPTGLCLVSHINDEPVSGLNAQRLETCEII
ncbi:MAG: hypothetical protein ACMXX9_01925 [Candidatus Woesearchaeota archaeon]